MDICQLCYRELDVKVCPSCGGHRISPITGVYVFEICISFGKGDTDDRNVTAYVDRTNLTSYIALYSIMEWWPMRLNKKSADKYEEIIKSFNNACFLPNNVTDIRPYLERLRKVAPLFHWRKQRWWQVVETWGRLKRTLMKF